MSGKYRHGNVGIGYVGSQPPFTTGQAVAVKLTVKNPSAEALTYVIALSLGPNLIGTFPSLTVEPGDVAETAAISGVAPTSAGTYPVYIDVNVDGEDLPQLHAGNVVVNEEITPPETPDIEIVSLVWL